MTSISLRNRSAPRTRGQFRPQHLDRDFAMMLDIFSEIDGGHAAGAEFALDGVAVGEGGREAGGDLGHQAKMGRLRGFGEVAAALRRPDALAVEHLHQGRLLCTSC